MILILISNKVFVYLIFIIFAYNYLNPKYMNRTIAILNASLMLMIICCFTEMKSQTFSCGENMTDSRDGKIYKTVLIGTQCWMQENLNAGAEITGKLDQKDNGIIEKYCYNDSTKYCDVYGGLYQWDEMMQYVSTEKTQGICMDGWHIPADAEWSTLTTYLGGEYYAGGKMKEDGTTHWRTPNEGADNSSGFTALPAGQSNFGDGSYTGISMYESFRSSTDDSGLGKLKYVMFNSFSVYVLSNNKAYGYSVRCVKNESNSGINTIENNILFYVYPDPVADILNICIPFHNFKTEISDITGKIVYSSYLTTHDINISNLSDGIYILKIKGDIFVENRKFVVKH